MLKCVDLTLPNYIKHSLGSPDQLCYDSMRLNFICLDFYKKNLNH